MTKRHGYTAEQVEAIAQFVWDYQTLINGEFYSRYEGALNIEKPFKGFVRYLTVTFPGDLDPDSVEKADEDAFAAIAEAEIVENISDTIEVVTATRQVWEHKKSGELYEITGFANVDGDDPSKREKYPETIIYKRLSDNFVASRRLDDWHRSFAYRFSRPVAVNRQDFLLDFIQLNTVSFRDRYGDYAKRFLYLISYSADRKTVEKFLKDWTE